jgi:hypothetical protein
MTRADTRDSTPPTNTSAIDDPQPSTRYLEPSPILADGGAQVGKLPASIPLQDLRDLGHPESPIKAIRAKCLDCSGSNDAEVRKCTATGCALWPFRMGVNPFHGRAQQ